MVDHHLGGIHMGTPPTPPPAEHVRFLAGLIAQNQRREIRDMETVQASLGP